MSMPLVDELVRPLVNAHKDEMERIARIKLSRRTRKIRFFVREGGGERELKLILCPGALARIEQEVRRRGTAFADEITRRLFKHVGFEVDSSDNLKLCETEWFRK